MIIGLVYTFLPFMITGGMLSLTSLDFLGLGVEAPYPSLGELLDHDDDLLAERGFPHEQVGGHHPTDHADGAAALGIGRGEKPPVRDRNAAREQKLIG